MRKKELIEIEPKHPSQEMISTAADDRYIEREYEKKTYTFKDGKWGPYTGIASDKTYGTRFYFTAKEESGILLIAMHTRDRLSKGDTKPEMVIYIDAAKEEWITRIGEKWSTALLYNLIDDQRPLKTLWNVAKDIYSEEDLQLVNRILGTEEEKIQKAVTNWQNAIRADENVRKAEKRAAYWGKQMAKIPPLPEGFDKWIEDEGTLDSNFILYKRKGKKTEAFCTHCGETFTTMVKMQHNAGDPDRYDYKVRHNYMCPKCNAILATKAWGKQRELKTTDNVVIMQPADEYVAFSKFRVVKKFRRVDNFPNGEKWERYMVVPETLRVLANRISFESVESYEIREVPLLKKEMWAEVKEGGYYGLQDKRPMNIGEGTLYTKNLEEVLKGTSVNPVVAELFLKREIKYPQSSFISAAAKRYIEYLLKAGLTRLANQAAREHIGVNAEAKNLKDLLDLDGQQLYELKQVNGNTCAVAALKYAKEHGEKLNRETLQFIADQHIDPAELGMQRTHMSLQRTVHYLAKQSQILKAAFHDVRRLYKDYLSMAYERGLDLTDDIVRHTPKLRILHDRYAEEKNINDAVNAGAGLNMRFRQIAERYAENSEHFQYERSGLVIVVPTCAADIKMEGALQHHCVGASDTYMNRMNKGESFILFLRKKEDPETPYYTLEVEYDGKIRQSYGAFDRKPDWEKVEPVIAGLTRTISQRLEKEQKTATVLSAAG